jgi:hypothetical protein
MYLYACSPLTLPRNCGIICEPAGSNGSIRRSIDSAAAPAAPNDELLLAWVWSNYRGAISHDSALALLG